MYKIYGELGTISGPQLSASVETVAGPVLGDMIPKILSDLLHAVEKTMPKLFPKWWCFMVKKTISRIHKRITSTQNSCDGSKSSSNL